VQVMMEYWKQEIEVFHSAEKFQKTYSEKMKVVFGSGL
jgi:uncharacterized protein YhfF